MDGHRHRPTNRRIPIDRVRKSTIKYGKITMNFRKFRFLKFKHVRSTFLVIKTLRPFRLNATRVVLEYQQKDDGRRRRKARVKEEEGEG